MKKLAAFVTIITPTYNRAKLLKETAESILSQDYEHIEYIIVDDGSTDKTQEIVAELKKKFQKSKIVYVRQKNSGETAAVNKGFALAKGKYIAVVSSDDPLLPGSIEELVGYLEKHPDILAVYPNWEMIDEKGRAIETVYPQKYDYITMLKEHYCIPGPGTFFRKDALKLTGGRTKEFRYLADFAFWLKLGMYGKLYHYPKVLATFRVHSGSQGVYARGTQMAAEHEKLVAWLFADKDVPKHARKVKNAAYASAYYHAAKESISTLTKIRYYSRSFTSDPLTFLNKLRYEGTKLKHTLQHLVHA